MYTLYGDGVRDDTAAIQELIDSGSNEVCLPPPEKFYVISKPLELPSNFRLVLPRFAEIRLADNSNCVMLRNKMVKDYAKRLSPDVYEKEILAYLWSYIDDYSPDAPCQNIEISGGVWNCNNQNQLPNPERKIDLSVREFYGCGMLFYNVKNFKISSLTIKDPSQYGMTLDTVSYFTVENITFDYNLGNPYPTNMDGIHLDGNCHYGTIRNLKGSCYDDMVALNAHEGSRGPITNIEINGLYSEYCHSAVRLLLVSEVIENIHISNVFGRFYQYCVGLTKFYPGETTGRYDAISLDNIYASKDMPVRKGEYQHPRKIEDSYPLIWVQEDMVVNNLTVRSLHRRERILPKDTIHIGEQAVIDSLILDDITTENYTGEPMILLNNCGTIRYLSMRNIDSGNDRTLVNSGIIENCVE